ncbi:MAG: hypothetical protein AAF922_13630 [Pseudomonadota bacterium]
MVKRAALLMLIVIYSAQDADARLDPLYCEPKEKLRHALENKHRAKLTGQGVRGPDVVLELWAEPESGDWTLVQTYANGQACVVAIGEHWEPPQTGGEPS